MSEFASWIEKLSPEQRALAREQLPALCVRAQLAATGLQSLPSPAVRVHGYEDVPDFDALSVLMTGEEVERPAGRWFAFVGSKPSIEEGEAQIHVLRAQEEAPEVPTFWLKAKRRAALVEAWSVTGEGTDSAAAASTAVLDWACAQVGRRPSSLILGEDILVESGPGLLMEPPVLEGGVLRMPALVTDMDMPDPFGGQLYIKVITPEAALAWALHG